MSEAIPYGTVNSGIFLIEGGEFFDFIFDPRTWAKIQKYDPGFARIWTGYSGNLPVGIWPQISHDGQGRLLYSGKLQKGPDGSLLFKGKRYNKDSWVTFYEGNIKLYGPPKAIRDQGRLAKETADIRNEHPNIAICNAAGKLICFSDVCCCGGGLVIDSREFLCCSECGAIYND